MASKSCVLSSAEQDLSELTVDRLSSLPWNVLNIILGKLSIIEAVHTSVLAKDWRYNWLSVSTLTLDHVVIASALKKANIRWDVFASIINRFLLYHSCSIRKFYLRAFCKPHYSDMYPWLQYLSQQNVEELFIEDLENQESFDLPSHLFHFEKLQYLFLKGCALKFPSTFGGFNFLCELSFNNVSIKQGDLGRLIHACPLLVKLGLFNMTGLELLKIFSPRLEVLEIDTRLGNIVIEVSACLVSVCIKNNFYSDRMRRNWRGVNRCLSGLSALQSLVLYDEFIEILAAYYALDTYPLRNDTLTCLSLCEVRFQNIEVFRVCLSLLSSCPNIKSFQFSIEAAKGAKLITAFLKENHGLFSFPQLESILVTCPSAGMGCTVNFIEFLCAHSPNLKDLTIKKGGRRQMNVNRASNMLSRFRKICPQASVQYIYNKQQTDL